MQGGFMRLWATARQCILFGCFLQTMPAVGCHISSILGFGCGDEVLDLIPHSFLYFIVQKLSGLFNQDTMFEPGISMTIAD